MSRLSSSPAGSVRADTNDESDTVSVCRDARQNEAMRVLFATAELSPIATVGGLAAAAAGLGVTNRSWSDVSPA